MYLSNDPGEDLDSEINKLNQIVSEVAMELLDNEPVFITQTPQEEQVYRSMANIRRWEKQGYSLGIIKEGVLPIGKFPSGLIGETYVMFQDSPCKQLYVIPLSNIEETCGRPEEIEIPRIYIRPVTLKRPLEKRGIIRV